MMVSDSACDEDIWGCERLTCPRHFGYGLPVKPGGLHKRRRAFYSERTIKCSKLGRGNVLDGRVLRFEGNELNMQDLDLDLGKGDIIAFKKKI